MDFCNNSIFRKIVITSFCLIFINSVGLAQSASEILNRSILYHDPDGYWDQFRGQLDITMEMPNGTGRHSLIKIEKKSGLFAMKVEKDGVRIDRSIKNGECMIRLNGSDSFSKEEQEKYGLTCERSQMYHNYYTYLYGMPMKIKDEGANLDPEATVVEFMGKEYWRLRVTYDEEVGSDIWYFYFNTNNYALEAYQFYHDESKNDGEYILFSEEVEFEEMKVPKIRKWYLNADGKYLGVDILNSIDSF